MLEELKTAKKVVGIKQLRRALKDRSAKLVFLAKDADPALTGPLLAQCCENGVEVVTDITMSELGKACGIAVSSAVPCGVNLVALINRFIRTCCRRESSVSISMLSCSVMK